MDSQVYAISKEIMEGPGEGLFDHIAECLAVFAKGTFFSKVKLSLLISTTFEFSRQNDMQISLKIDVSACKIWLKVKCYQF